MCKSKQWKELADDIIIKHNELCSLERKIDEESVWKFTHPWQVISIHSHVGGVGKTTLAIALAQQFIQQGKRSCIVDCNDEGPSLQTFFPTNKKSAKYKPMFFSDWFCNNHIDVPDELIHFIPNYNDLLAIVPGSMCSNDIDQLDKIQRGGRPPFGRYDYFQDRIKILAANLIRKKGFDNVIFDTNPGLAHLSYDILLGLKSTSRVYVIMPRPADIALLCFEDELIFKYPLVCNSTVAINFYDLKAEPTLKSIINEMSHHPYFVEQCLRMYKDMGIGSGLGIKESAYIEMIVGANVNKLGILASNCSTCPDYSSASLYYCPTIPKLHKASSLQLDSKEHYPLSEIIRNAKEMQTLAANILARLGYQNK